MKIFICKQCNMVEFNNAPATCAVCQSPVFVQNDNVFKESAEKSKEAAVKHIPAITVQKECKLITEASCSDVIVRIGKTLHPAEEKHHIEFIDAYLDEKFIERVYLTPSVFPATCLHLNAAGSKITIVEHCNIHGYWMAEEKLG